MRRFPTIAMAAVLATALVAASPAVAKKKDNGDGGSTPPAVEPASKPEKPGKDDGITLLTQDCDLLDGCRIEHDGEDHLRARGGLGWRRRRDRTLRDQGRHRLRPPREHGHLVTASQEPARNWRTHCSQSDDRDSHASDCRGLRAPGSRLWALGSRLWAFGWRGL